MSHIEGFRCKISLETKDCKDCLMNGTDNVLFECCLHQQCRIGYLRPIQGHPRGIIIDPKLQKNVKISNGKTDV